MLKIGSIQIEPPLVLAPMADITDRQFRLILRRIGGVGLVTMEFVSSEGLTRGNRRTIRMMGFSEEERPISIQIYGSDPERMARAAVAVERSGAEICDINMGCPARKILRHSAGCALMRDLDLARSIIKAVRRTIRIPLTVKFRTGMDDGSLNYIELGRLCQEEGVDAVTLHARTAKQMFGGSADWECIARLKNALSIPVIGNGDVAEAPDALRMFTETGCDAVMIGRASMKNPWIYRQIADLLCGVEPQPPTIEDRRELILTHFRLLMRDERDPRLIMHKLRTFTGWYTRGLTGGRKLRVKISGLSSPEQFIEAVESFFCEGPPAA
jgi:nifR3 family TIM-barrel protein